MKKLVVYALCTYTALILHAESKPSISKVQMIQNALVSQLISSAKSTIPVTIANKQEAIVCYEKLDQFLKIHPEALECVIDTFQRCIQEECLTIAQRVDECIEEFDTSRSLYMPEPEQIQQKISALVICYFNFQLTPLGAVDHYSQDYFRKTGLNTLLSIAVPLANLVGIYYTLVFLLDHLKGVSLLQDQKNNHTLLQEMTKTMFSTIGANLLVPGIQPSVNKISKYTKETFDKFYASVTNKPYKPGYPPIKSSSESFKTVAGYTAIKEQLTPLVFFCTHLIEHRAADLKMSRGYLLVGDLSDGKKIAQAVAGEISEKLKQLGSVEEYRIYDIHGSALISQKLDSSLQDCLEHGPTVCIINNIDWIYTQKDVDPSVYAHIISTLPRYMGSDSNYPLIVFATSKDESVIDPVMLEKNKFEVITLS